MVRIYALKNGEEVLYVGQTIRTLERRAAVHRAPSNATGSRHIPPEVHWEITLLEECEENIATARERHFIETLSPPYNKNIPGRTKAEYNQTEAVKARKKAHYQTEAWKAANRERMRSYMRSYLQTEAGKAANRERSRLNREKKKALLQENGE